MGRQDANVATFSPAKELMWQYFHQQFTYQYKVGSDISKPIIV